MKIIATRHLGRYGRQFKPGETLDVPPHDAHMYVHSGQATYAPDKPPRQAAGRPPAAPPEPVQPEPAAPEPAPEEEVPTEDTPVRQAAEDPPRKGRHRRRDVKAEGDGD